jgi:hypothetical protein
VGTTILNLWVFFRISPRITWSGSSENTPPRGVDDTPGGASADDVCEHGGPTWNWGAYFSDSEPNAVPLASAGYACLLPNPRGSAGRGHAVAQVVIGDGGHRLSRHHGGRGPRDRRGDRGPEPPRHRRLSYAGFMAGWAVGQTDRFAAAVAMSVVSNYVLFHLT